MKKKVLLVYDDFNEMTLTESYLKKVGVDVVGISNEALLSDQILSFHPDVVVIFRQKQKNSSFSVSQKLEKNRNFNGKIVVIVPKGVRPSPEDMIKMRMAAFLEAPVPIGHLVEILGKILGLDIALLKTKLQRTQGQTKGKEVFPESSTESDKLRSDPKRMAKYSEFLGKEGGDEAKKLDIKHTSFQHDEVRKKQKEAQVEYEVEELGELEEQDKLKREFVKALFKKNEKK